MSSHRQTLPPDDFVARMRANGSTAPLRLASGSPRRRELLTNYGYQFESALTQIDETPREGESAEELVVRLAIEKSRDTRVPQSPQVTLSADTVGIANGELLNKPRDQEDARAMLAKLRGSSVQFITGLAVRFVVPDSNAELVISSLVVSRVVLKSMTDGAIQRYVASGEPLDKAGALGIQGQGRELVAHIDGCYTNVVGLPMCEVAGILRWLGSYASPKACQDDTGHHCPRWGTLIGGDWQFLYSC